MKWSFSLLTVQKRSISLKDYGRNNFYFRIESEERSPMQVDRNRKKSMGNGLEQKLFSTKSCFKTVEKSLLIFRIKVRMSYHIALDVVATNLHTMFLIDNIFISVCGFMFSNSSQSMFS